MTSNGCGCPKQPTIVSKLHLTPLVAVCVLLAVGALTGVGCKPRDSRIAAQPQPMVEPPGPRVIEQWGIQIESIRLSAAGYMLDFRYTILDPDKALPLFSRKTRPILVDQASGVEVTVPTSAKVGPLRQTAEKLEANRTYWMFFANPGKLIKPGNKVTVIIGDFKTGDLIVQ